MKKIHINLVIIYSSKKVTHNTLDYRQVQIIDAVTLFCI